MLRSRKGSHAHDVVVELNDVDVPPAILDLQPSSAELLPTAN